MPSYSSSNDNKPPPSPESPASGGGEGEGASASADAEKISKESELIRQTLLELAPFCLEDCGFEAQSVEIRKVRFHKKVGKSWTP